MKRLRRILLNLVAATWALLIVMTVVLWVCSKSHETLVRYIRTGANQVSCGVSAAQGALRLGLTIDATNISSGTTPDGWSMESIPIANAASAPVTNGTNYRHVGTFAKSGWNWGGSCFGFGIGWYDGNSPFLGRRRMLDAEVPLWFAPIAAAACPLLWIFLRHRRQSTIRAGACASCGYDLRATTGRCPECGTVPAEPSAR